MVIASNSLEMKIRPCFTNLNPRGINQSFHNTLLRTVEIHPVPVAPSVGFQMVYHKPREMVAMQPLLKTASRKLSLFPKMHQLFAVPAKLQKSLAVEQVAAPYERLHTVRLVSQRFHLVLSCNRVVDGKLKQSRSSQVLANRPPLQATPPLETSRRLNSNSILSPFPAPTDCGGRCTPWTQKTS